jgi:hypothetical protein
MLRRRNFGVLSSKGLRRVVGHSQHHDWTTPREACGRACQARETSELVRFWIARWRRFRWKRNDPVVARA